MDSVSVKLSCKTFKGKSGRRRSELKQQSRGWMTWRMFYQKWNMKMNMNKALDLNFNNCAGTEWISVDECGWPRSKVYLLVTFMKEMKLSYNWKLADNVYIYLKRPIHGLKVKSSVREARKMHRNLNIFVL